ncbi:MAG: sulfurtransferase TusA family protein [Raoultibacter sp.]|jgi:tRNA 2-thiouridine synthesizing protein A
MIELDAKGLFCPEPLMMVTDAMKENPGQPIHILVNQASPRDNIIRFAEKKGRSVSVSESTAGVFSITIS